MAMLNTRPSPRGHLPTSLHRSRRIIIKRMCSGLRVDNPDPWAWQVSHSGLLVLLVGLKGDRSLTISRDDNRPRIPLSTSVLPSYQITRRAC